MKEFQRYTVHIINDVKGHDGLSHHCWIVSTVFNPPHSINECNVEFLQNLSPECSSAFKRHDIMSSWKLWNNEKPNETFLVYVFFYLSSSAPQPKEISDLKK